MSKREREKEDDEGSVEKCMENDNNSDILSALESLKNMKEKMKRMKEKMKKMKENLTKIEEYLHGEFEKKVPVEKRKGEETYLHFAAFLGHVEAIKVLLGNGSDVNAVNKIEETALHVAAYFGNVDVMKVLIQNGADANAVDRWELTALHWAARNGQRSVGSFGLGFRNFEEQREREREREISNSRF